MVISRRHRLFLVLPLILLMLLTACERPLASNDSETAEESAEATAVAETAEAESDNEAVDDAEVADEGDAGASSDSGEDADQSDQAEGEGDVAEETESSDPDVGGGTPDTAEQEEVTGSTDADEAGAEDETEDEAASQESDTDVAGAEESMTEADSEEDAQADVSDDDADAASSELTEDEEPEVADTEDTATEDTATEEMAAEESTEVVDTATLPATHTVQPGENLYRIGLQYGMSWVTLAAYNHLPNANYIRVGQVLQIPGGTPNPAPPPTTPDEPGYTNYVVQRGDTLNSIGRKFGVSWVEIAEANGIVNPNLIYAGQVLKIPTSQPETTPSLTHTVSSGETLYRISLQYGVSWLAIAQANNIAPPYVIYPGQVLVIPGG